MGMTMRLLNRTALDEPLGERWWRFQTQAFTVPGLACELCRTFPDGGFRRSARSGSDKSYALSSRIVVGPESSDNTDLAPLWRTLIGEVTSPEYRAALARAAGLDLSGARLELALWRYDAGCFLSPHLDKEEKLVTQLFYFNEAWPAGPGGELLILEGPSDAAPLARLRPEAGASALLRRTNCSWHAVAKVDGDLVRRSLQVVFYRP